ncbi:MAG TPA: phosphate signaling complex protein PhoU [Gemmataceae bacterium]|nr:phosphate signaling complex protein PhoU [Gemmataceae bacterium]
MSKHWERDLDNLQRLLMTLAASVEEAIFKGIRALQERDPSLAGEVVAGDSAIDQEENHVENECLKMLALHQPVAGDLRRIIAALKINTDLERMADLAVNIAERALILAGLPRIAVPDKLQRMTDLTTAMVRQSLDAFVMLNAEQARGIIRLDEEVDRYNSEIIDELIREMQQASAQVPAFLAFFSAVRQLERIADHATNIAEDVVYLIEGEIIRHLRMSIDERS